MALFSIMSSDGQTTRYSGKLRYNGIFGGASYVEFSQISSPTLIDFHVGDYLDYSRTGFRYRLYSVPLPTKKSGNNTVGDSYIYKNVQLHCATKDLELAPFRDLVLNDNLIHFTTLPTISVYDDVYGIAERIQACMDDFAGTGVWNITVMNTSDPAVLTVLQQEKEYSVSGVSCLEALNEIYKLWSGIGWVYSVVNGVNTITLGRPNVQDSGNTTDVFSYGLGNGLTVIAQAVSSKNEMATRLYVYGSDRNMPPRYYNNVTPAIYSAESVYIPNLMIPLEYWGTTSSKRDARKAFVDNATAISQYGLIPKTIYFDGSGDYEEIYPSIEGVTFAELRAAMGSGAEYYPSPSRYPNGDYVNTIKAVVNPTDNGIVEEDGERYLEAGSVPVSAISNTAPYLDGQAVLNITPGGGVIASYTALHSGVMRISSPLVFSVECQDALEVTANFVVVVNGTAVQVVPATVNATRLDWTFAFPSIRQKVEQGDVVSVFAGIDVRFRGTQGAGNVVVQSAATTMDFNVQYSISDTFSVTLKQIGFDISKQGGVLSDGLATLSMKSGMCGGREFVIKSCKYDSLQDQWELECYRQKDDSLGQYFPNSIYPMAAEDSYVLVDMMMPKIYVQSAEGRLYERALQVLAQMSKPKIIFTPEVDAKVLALSPETILEGMYMPVYDENLIPTTEQAYPHTTWVLINSLVIAEDEAAIPTYKVTLQDEKANSFIQLLTNQMNLNAQRIRESDEAASRSPYIEGQDATVPVAARVEIISNGEFFTYTSGSSTPVEDSIILQAIPYDIPAPSYQWYYYGNSGWVALSGATGQTYTVNPANPYYYPTGDDVAQFRVVVTYGGATYFAEKNIAKLRGGEGEDGMTFLLSNPAHVFAAGADGYAYYGTDTLYVYAFQGTTRLTTTIGTISGTVTGLSTSVSNNNTDHTSIIVSAGTSLNQNGTLVIPVTAGGVTIELRYGWTLAAKGEPGQPGVKGKVLRGPSTWEMNHEYKGLDGTSEFVDFCIANSGNIYYCKKDHTSSLAITLANREYWEPTTMTNFVATKVLYTEYGFVKYLGANSVKIANSSGTIYGGFMPPNTDGNGEYILWAGGSTPSDATIKMHQNGTGYFGPYSLGPDGFEYSVSNSNYSKAVNLTLDDLYFYYAQQGSTGYARIRPRLGDAILEVYQQGNLAALNKPGIKVSALGSGVAISSPYGVYEGMRPSIKVATSLETLTDLDHTVIIPETVSSVADIYLPTSPKNGQEYLIINYSSYSATVGYSGTATHKIKMLSTSSTTGVNSITLTSRRVVHLVYSSSYGHWIGWYDL